MSSTCRSAKPPASAAAGRQRGKPSFHVYACRCLSTNRNTLADCHANGHADTIADCHANRDADTIAGRRANCDADTIAGRHANSDADTITDRHAADDPGRRYPRACAAARNPGHWRLRWRMQRGGRRLGGQRSGRRGAHGSSPARADESRRLEAVATGPGRARSSGHVAAGESAVVIRRHARRYGSAGTGSYARVSDRGNPEGRATFPSTI